MISTFFSGAFGKYLSIILLIVIALGAGFHTYKVSQLNGQLIEKSDYIAILEAKNGKLEAEKAGLTLANKVFKDATETQNNSLIQLKDVVMVNQKNTMIELVKTREANGRLRLVYQDILTRSPASSDPCKAFDTRANEYIEQRRKGVSK